MVQSSRRSPLHKFVIQAIKNAPPRPSKPIDQAEVEWTSTETGHKYTLKTNNKGEYFSLGVVPGKYNVKLSKDGKQLFTLSGITVTLEETDQDFDLKKEKAKESLPVSLIARGIRGIAGYTVALADDAVLAVFG